MTARVIAPKNTIAAALLLAAAGFIVEDIGPCEAGANSTVSLHFFFGKSCAGQLVAPEGNPNSCGLVPGTVASGFPKVIGGPCVAVLLSVSVTRLAFPTFTFPKS